MKSGIHSPPMIDTNIYLNYPLGSIEVVYNPLGNA